MAKLDRQTFRISFTIICSAIVCCMVGYWCYKYEIEDRDIGVVDYVAIQEMERDFKLPVASLCFKDPFLVHKLNEMPFAINSSIYQRYLIGMQFDDNITTINYSDVTINLKDYFLFVQELWRNDSVYGGRRITVESKVTFSGFLYKNLVKCFLLKNDMATINHVEQIKFTYDIQKLDHEWGRFISSPIMYFKIHYPGQFLLGDEPTPFMYPVLLGSNATFLQVAINEIEILKRRQTRKKSCVANPENYDTMIMKKHIEKKGCKDVLMSIQDSTPTCKTKEDIQNFSFDYKSPATLGIPNACQRISNLRLNAEAFRGLPEQKNNQWIFLLYYPKEVRIITQSKEVDIHTLIGNIGGYLGLFIGE